MDVAGRAEGTRPLRNFSVQLINYRCFAGPTPVKWHFTGNTQRTVAVLPTTLRGVDDSAEIPTYEGSGPVVIDFGIAVENAAEVTRVRLTIDRATSMCTTRVWVGSSRDQREARGNAQHPSAITDTDGRSLSLADGEFTQWMAQMTSSTLYVPAYRNLINQGGGQYYDIAVGQDFIKTWDSWKNGNSKLQRQTILGVLADIKAIFGFRDLNAESTPQQDTLQITVDGRSERIRELGAGLSQFIITLGNVAMKRPELLLFDEPELNLHPALQLKFLTALSKYARHILFSTHSLGLARAASAAYSVVRQGPTSVLKPLAASRSYAELLGEMSFAAYQELGFEQILCVEGVHDVLATQHYLRLLGLDQKVVVIPLGGNQLINENTSVQLGELHRITPKISALIDSERTAAAPLSAQRQGFIDRCTAIGIRAHATERRAFEHYFTDAAVKGAKGPGVRALHPYEDFTTLPHAWTKDDNGRIAQHMSADDLMATDIGSFLADLGTAWN